MWRLVHRKGKREENPREDQEGATDSSASSDIKKHREVAVFRTKNYQGGYWSVRRGVSQA